MYLKNCVLEASRVDFGGLGGRFGKVWERFFEILAFLAKRNAGTEQLAVEQLGADQLGVEQFRVEQLRVG